MAKKKPRNNLPKQYLIPIILASIMWSLSILAPIIPIFGPVLMAILLLLGTILAVLSFSSCDRRYKKQVYQAISNAFLASVLVVITIWLVYAGLLLIAPNDYNGYSGFAGLMILLVGLPIALFFIVLAIVLKKSANSYSEKKKTRKATPRRRKNEYTDDSFLLKLYLIS